jgi:hypothetical protein
MRNVTFITGTLFVIFALGACSDDSSPNKSVGSKMGACYGSSGQTCTGTAEYESCLISKCDAKLKTCYGSDYQNGNFGGGACVDLITCMGACKCDSTYSSCSQNCAMTKMNAGCTSCSTEMVSCIQGAGCKEPVCTGGTTDGSTAKKEGGTAADIKIAITGTCTDLATCCAAIQEALKSSCDQLVSGKNDQACGAAYTSWKTAGICK